jgi:hypothetical protein
MPVIDLYLSPVRRSFMYPVLAERLYQWYDFYGKHKRSPEADMFAFYYLNQSVNVLESLYGLYGDLQEKQRIVDDYIKTTLEVAEHIVVYLLFICLRETRHAYNKNPNFKAWAQLPENKETAAVIMSLRNTGPLKSIEQAVKFLKTSQLSISTLLQSISKLFVCGCFGMSCGGKNWKTITDFALDYFKGKLTTEMFVDLCFNLEHNTSDIFIKGIVLEPSRPFFKALLDIQHEGKLPVLLKYSENIFKQIYANKTYEKLMDYEKMFPLAVENDEMYLLKYKMLKDLIAVKLEGKLTYLPFPLVNEVLVEKRKM